MGSAKESSAFKKHCTVLSKGLWYYNGVSSNLSRKVKDTISLLTPFSSIKALLILFIYPTFILIQHNYNFYKLCPPTNTPRYMWIINILRWNPPEVRVTSGQKPSTKIIYYLLKTIHF